jgi:heme/copper-type cytochrome/quinol oxidase subunit 3
VSVAANALPEAPEGPVAPRVAGPDHPALVPAPGGVPIGWWGLAWLVATEATLFGGLLSAWFFTRAAADRWPEGGIAPPELGRITVFTVVLLASSLPLVWGEAAIRRGHVRGLRVALALSFLLGAAFLANQVVDYRDLTFGIRDNAYASLFYVTTGLHGMHVAVGLVLSLAVQAKVAAGRIDADDHLSVRVFSLYWHFVDVVWIAVFSSLYLSTHVR